MEPGFEKHVFVCTNLRAEGHVRGCCDGRGSVDLLFRLKKLVKERGLKGRFRINKAGCLDHCEHGAAMVVYPEGVWYGGVSAEDAEEIVEEHLLADRPVERLRIGEKLPPQGGS